MPEGDTLFRTAAGLRPYLVGRDVLAARAQGPGPVPQVQRVVGKRDRCGRSAGQEPADPVRRRPRAPDASADERLVAPLSAGRALASTARPGAARARGRWRGRGLLRRAGRRAVRDARRARSIRPCRGSGRTCWRPTSMRPRRIAGCAIPTRADADDRRRAARPARAGRHRQHLPERDAVGRARRPVRAASPTLDDATLDRLIATARRLMLPTSTRDAAERVTTAGDRGAPARSTSTAGTGRPCPRCGTPIAVDPARATTCRARRTGARPARGTAAMSDDRVGCAARRPTAGAAP